MNLTKRTLVYSILLALGTALLVLFYLLYLLPSLYIGHMKENNLNISRKFMENVIASKDLKGSTPPSRFSTMIVSIPKEGSNLKVWNGVTYFEISFKDKEIVHLIDLIRKIPIDGNADEKLFEGINPTKVWESFMHSLKSQNFEVFNVESKAGSEINDDADYGFYKGDDYVLLESSIMENKNLYTNFFGIGKKDGTTYLAMIPFSVSKIDDIRSIALGSLPMILSVLTLLTMVFALIYSKLIVNPIVKLRNHTDDLRQSSFKEMNPFERKENDEIKDLGQDIDAMYRELVNTMEKLKDELESRDLFLKAGSHQLKTPVAASLLLVEGMIGKIGKYEDRDKYLPEVKKQMHAMQKIIEDLLLLNRMENLKEMETVNIKELVEEILMDNSLGISEKGITLDLRLKDKKIRTSYFGIRKILENLLSNAITHGSKNSRLIIDEVTGGIEIINTNAHIDDEIKKTMFLPFVTSRKTMKSAGLGLYIARKYAKDLNMEISIDNSEDDVRSYIKME